MIFTSFDSLLVCLASLLSAIVCPLSWARALLVSHSVSVSTIPFDLESFPCFWDFQEDPLFFLLINWQMTSFALTFLTVFRGTFRTSLHDTWFFPVFLQEDQSAFGCCSFSFLDWVWTESEIVPAAVLCISCMPFISGILLFHSIARFYHSIAGSFHSFAEFSLNDLI